MNDFRVDACIGMLLGGVLGDSLGMQYEFVPTRQIDAATLTFRDSSFLPLKAGEWSDDGDMMLLLCEALTESADPEIAGRLLAHKLADWYDRGYVRAAKSSSAGCGNTVARVITSPGFREDHATASKRAYEAFRSESNGGVIRIAPVGVVSADLDRVCDMSVALTRVTHHGQLAQSASMTVSMIISGILHGLFNAHNVYEVDRFIHTVRIKALTFLTSAASKVEYLRYLSVTELADVRCDEEFKVGYCLKTMSVAIWVLRNHLDMSFTSMLSRVFSQGGDTDSNGCVAGCVFGAIYGHRMIPEQLVQGLVSSNVVTDVGRALGARYFL